QLPIRRTDRVARLVSDGVEVSGVLALDDGRVEIGSWVHRGPSSVDGRRSLDRGAPMTRSRHGAAPDGADGEGVRGGGGQERRIVARVRAPDGRTGALRAFDADGRECGRRLTEDFVAARDEVAGLVPVLLDEVVDEAGAVGRLDQLHAQTIADDGTIDLGPRLP